MVSSAKIAKNNMNPLVSEFGSKRQNVLGLIGIAIDPLQHDVTGMISTSAMHVS